jgi:hypothetical protein
MLEQPAVCTLDCPDTCSLTVTVESGRITKVRGSDALPLTSGVICNKVANAEWCGIVSSMLRPQNHLYARLTLISRHSSRSERMAKHVTEDQHPDHEHRIDRGPTDRGIVGCQLGMHPRQIENGGNIAHKVIVRHHLLEAEGSTARDKRGRRARNRH